jgi:hypothetical protein
MGMHSRQREGKPNILNPFFEAYGDLSVGGKLLQYHAIFKGRDQ